MKDLIKRIPPSAAIFVALLIVGAVIGVLASRRATADIMPAVQPSADATYLRLDVFASSTLEQVPGALLEEFKKGTLLTAGEWEIPNKDGAKLVAATPTLTGKRESVGCGETHPLCGLYLVTPDQTTLVTWGAPLRGFGGIHGFSDTDHVRVWTAWSLMSYTNAEERIVDLRDGTSTSSVMMELDDNGPSAELTVTRGADKVVLTVEGETVQDKNKPAAIRVRKNQQKALSLDAKSIERLAAVGAPRTEPVIGLSEASFPDAQTEKMLIQLYGKSMVIDLKAGTLQPNENF
jgi:hypothetical protein